MNDKKRAWIYIRVDRSEYASAILEIQKLELQNFADEKGCIVAGISADIGSGRYLDRLGLKQMSDAAQHNRFDILLVARYDCLCSDMAPLSAYLCQLQALGLDICSPIEGSVKNYNCFSIEDTGSGVEMESL